MERLETGSLDGWIASGVALLTMLGGLLLWTHRRAYERGRREAAEKRRGEELQEFKEHVDERFDKVDQRIDEVHRRIDDHLNQCRSE